MEAESKPTRPPRLGSPIRVVLLLSLAGYLASYLVVRQRATLESVGGLPPTQRAPVFDPERPTDRMLFALFLPAMAADPWVTGLGGTLDQPAPGDEKGARPVMSRQAKGHQAGAAAKEAAQRRAAEMEAAQRRAVEEAAKEAAQRRAAEEARRRAEDAIRQALESAQLKVPVVAPDQPDPPGPAQLQYEIPGASWVAQGPAYEAALSGSENLRAVQNWLSLSLRSYDRAHPLEVKLAPGREWVDGEVWLSKESGKFVVATPGSTVEVAALPEVEPHNLASIAHTLLVEMTEADTPAPYPEEKEIALGLQEFADSFELRSFNRAFASLAPKVFTRTTVPIVASPPPEDDPGSSANGEDPAPQDPDPNTVSTVGTVSTAGAAALKAEAEAARLEAKRRAKAALDSALNRATAGFNIPTVVDVDRPHPVVLALWPHREGGHEATSGGRSGGGAAVENRPPPPAERGEAVVRDHLSEGTSASADDVIHIAPVVATQHMEATLKGSAFEVSALTPERQLVLDGGVTEWRWEITGNQPGEHRVHVVLNAVLSSGGVETHRVVRVFERSVAVRVGGGGLLVALSVGSVSLLAGLASGLLIARQRIRHRRHSSAPAGGGAGPEPDHPGSPVVFVSYARTDADRVVPLCEFLRARGYPVWIDQAGIEGSRDWSEEIVKAIGRSSVVLVACSPASLASENVRREISIAAEDGKALLPVHLEPVTYPASFRYFLAGVQHVAVEGTSYERVISALEGLALKS